MELIGIRLWKGVAKQIAGISRCLPARRRVGGERTALGEKRTLKSHTHTKLQIHREASPVTIAGVYFFKNMFEVQKIFQFCKFVWKAKLRIKVWVFIYFIL